jgi:hypothetical protein
MAGLIWAAAHPGATAMALASSSATGIRSSAALKGTVALEPMPTDPASSYGRSATITIRL